MAVADRRRTPVSIVCVFNDLDVRTSCLDRSIEAGLADAPNTEYIPVDNRTGRFSSAGAALNDGARRARRDVVVFVHQDVYLHSLVALETAAAALQDEPDVGLVGAVGITSSGSVAGIVRDRVVLIGEPSSRSAQIDSVDEVLFMVERECMLDEPLTEHPDLAWHAYAVEYGARLRSKGLRVATRDVVLTHNSLTTNLSRLAEAHDLVADVYPHLLPIRTTCGVIRARRDRGRWRSAARRRHGVAVWLEESLAAARLARHAGLRTVDVVLGDIRLTIDDALRTLGVPAIDIVNLDASASGTGAWTVDSLSRRDRDVSARIADLDDAVRMVGGVRIDRALLVSGVDAHAMSRLAPALRGTPHVVGLARDTGAWVLCHAITSQTGSGLRALWPGRRNAPFGRRPGAATRARVSGDAPAERSGLTGVVDDA
ncbi:glycosyltransferase [Cellulomonas fimi]|uniref:Uncharacterized protein n=1 Tax=Cellulomonas fimi TaxID=1708 RepID=A0A7Y0M0P1_CELFI|nr:glycosyltransferase [Cellulomonas fimi]NMR21441.1 hypothetical protein [Cellulomonas fimi]